MHIPFWQVWRAPQAFPQPPQFAVSVSSLTQERPHWVRPEAQDEAQIPAEQTWFVEQAVVQVPQEEADDARSTH